MRVGIPTFKSKSELFDYLRSNKEKIITEKKSMAITAEANTFSYTKIKRKPAVSIKSAHDDDEDEDVVRVKVVANSCNILDAHMDVLLTDSAKKTIKERKGIIPHIHDHIHRIDAKVGDVVDILLQDISFLELGLEGSGATQCIVFITDVLRSMNEQIFKQYRDKKINQHSIGLRYVNIQLAINDPEDPTHFPVWEEHIDKIINKEKALERGFFWAVKEILLIENSAVLFGSNEVTPTLEVEQKDVDGPPEGTQSDGAAQESTPEKNLELLYKLI